MNNKLRIIKEKTEAIMSNMQCVLDDINNFEGYDELFTMESAMARTAREAKETYEMILNMYDELDEE